MTEIYRTAAYRCPVCPSAGLREFHERWVCDECQGMLLTIEDFRRACGDFTGSDAEVVLVERRPDPRTCPRCEQPFEGCRLDVDGIMATARPSGNQRRYSRDDIALIAYAISLQQQGIPRTGIARILSLERDVARLAAEQGHRVDLVDD